MQRSGSKRHEASASATGRVRQPGRRARAVMRRHIANLVSRPASSLLVVASVVAALFMPGFASGSTRAAKAGLELTLFSRVTQEQFLNHADDRQRGYGNNPFGNFYQAKARTNEQSNGPFPGDQALFEFNVYSGNDLKKLAGSAVFNCNYGFKKRGFCDAVYQLSGGTLVASGPLDFNASNFSLVITGGTGKYRSVAGEVVAMPSAHGSQRLAIALG